MDVQATQQAPIRGKVAAVVTPTSLAINRGRIHGVTNGMKFGVYFSVGPIVDPDDPLNVVSELQFRKGTVTISRVYDKMSYGSIDAVFVPKRGILPDLSGLSGFGSLNISSTEASYPKVESPMYSDTDRVIRVGDLAEQIQDTPKER